MNKIVFKLTTAVSTAALLTGSVASVAFGTTTVTVSGNGADSDNTANVSVNTSKTIQQTNNADINNSVNIDANSGGNSANKNTGGDVSIDTGDANVSSSVSNSANSNAAEIGCGSCPGDLNVKIAGNGADSDNEANLQVKSETNVYQVNNADVNNKVNVDANTGDNSAYKNTGGDVSIDTGDADVTVDVTNAVNQNVAKIGGGQGGAVDVEISGNGADSDNTVNLGLSNDVEVIQQNNADIRNNIDVDANSGDNSAKKNTGGDVSIDTGDADVEVAVDNRANFNGLDLSDCDCAMDLNVKVAGNGADSDNKVNAQFTSGLVAAQENNFQCGGSQGLEIWSKHSKGDCAGVNVDSNTGDNKANENTAKNHDPMVSTGDAGADVEVATDANSNVIGDVTMPSMPHLPNDLNGWIVFLAGMLNSH